MKFHLSEHAQKRIVERNLPIPASNLKLRVTGKKTRRVLRETCKKSFTMKDRIFFRLNPSIIYVCKQIDVGEYLVLTAFDLNTNKKRED